MSRRHKGLGEQMIALGSHNFNDPEVIAARKQAIENLREVVRDLVNDIEAEYILIALRPDPDCPHEPRHAEERVTAWITSDHVVPWLDMLHELNEMVMEANPPIAAAYMTYKLVKAQEDVRESARKIADSGKDDDDGEFKLTPDTEI